jgi:hypothetical protein
MLGIGREEAEEGQAGHHDHLIGLLRRERAAMTATDTRARFAREEGSALVWALLLALIGALMIGALATALFSSTSGTRRSRGNEVARAAAEAGVNAAVFRIEAQTSAGAGSGGIESYLAASLGAAAAGGTRPGTLQFAGTLADSTYTVTVSDPSAGDGLFTLTSVGTDRVTSGRRTLEALVRQEQLAALSFALFGNRIHFDNHNRVNYGLSLNTSIHSNSSVLIDRGVRIIGQVRGVTTVEPNTGPARSDTSVPSTVLSPAGEQGDPNPITTVATAPVVQVVPPPDVLPFPSFDFYAAQQAAIAAGRSINSSTLATLISQAQSYAQGRPSDGVAYAMPQSSYPSGTSATSIPIEVVHYKTGAANPNPRSITVPNSTNADAFVPLGSSNGTSNPASGTNLYEIRFVGNPLSDTLLFVTNSVSFNGPPTTLLQFQGSLIVNGLVSINAPMEILGWYNRTGPKFVPLGQSLYTDSSGASTVATTAAQAAAGQPYDIVYSDWPALAANGQIKISSSGSSQGGPVHIEGVVYSVAESHLHKTEARETAYAVGSEIADVIHNCQWFSFAYDPRALLTLGLGGRVSGRLPLTVIRLQEFTR